MSTRKKKLEQDSHHYLLTKDAVNVSNGPEFFFYHKISNLHLRILVSTQCGDEGQVSVFQASKQSDERTGSGKGFLILGRGTSRKEHVTYGVITSS